VWNPYQSAVYIPFKQKDPLLDFRIMMDMQTPAISATRCVPVDCDVATRISEQSLTLITTQEAECVIPDEGHINDRGLIHRHRAPPMIGPCNMEVDVQNYDIGDENIPAQARYPHVYRAHQHGRFP